MGEKTRLRFGGREVVLEKSDQLVGVKPRSTTRGADRTTIRLTDSNTKTGQRLGGFIIHRLSDSADETNRQLDLLRSNPEVGVASHVFHTSTDNVPFIPTGAIFIAFRQGLSKVKKEEILESRGLVILESRAENEFVVKTTALSKNPVRVAEDLQNSGLVEVAEPELASPATIKSLSLPGDGLLKEQWHLRNVGLHRGSSTGFVSGADARVIDAWELAASVELTDVVLAVIDDGFDLTHPDLSLPGKIVFPWDFTRETDQPLPGPGDWHGTACAGVATASSGAGSVVGAAPNAKFMPVRWGIDLSDSQIERWFTYVQAHGASVVSCSWGALANNFPLSTRMQRAIATCATSGRNGKGSVVVFAAGNSNHDIDDSASGTVDGFAIHPDVIAVSASTSKDTRAEYSNFGHAISVCAPSSGVGGWGILTSDVTGDLVENGISKFRGYSEGDYTFDFGGTSSACPLVAGICALVLSVNSELSAKQVKEIIISTARKIGLTSEYADGHSKLYGYGCVNAAAAVERALATTNIGSTNTTFTSALADVKV